MGKKTLIFDLKKNQWEIDTKDLDIEKAVISWHGTKQENPFLIHVSFLYDEWTNKYPYSSWSNSEQETFIYKDNKNRFYLNQDVLEFHIKPKKIRLHFTFAQKISKLFFSAKTYGAMNKEVACYDNISLCPSRYYSQFDMNHKDANRICCPTSVMNSLYLLNNNDISLQYLLENTVEKKFNTYGTWIFASAIAYQLYPKANPRVTWIESLTELIEFLKNGKPIIASIKGFLKEAPSTYSEGHLLVIYGINIRSGEVFCIDSAFKSNDKICVAYSLKEFCECWKKSSYAAIVF